MTRAPGVARSRLLSTALLVVAWVLAPLAVAELAARARGATPWRAEPIERPWAEPDPVLGWTNAVGRFESHEPGAAPMTFWEGGRRATRASPATAKPLRVVLVGGSMTQGQGVRDEQTFGWLLEAAFDELAFENYGTGGYGTHQSLLRLEQLLAEPGPPPVGVVYGFAGFHGARNVQTHDWLQMLRTSSGERYVAPRVQPGPAGLERLPPSSLPGWPGERRSALIRVLHDAWYRWRLRERGAAVLPATRELLVQMQRRVEAAGSRLLVAILHDPGAPRRYRSFLARAGIDRVDCRMKGELFADPSLRVGGVGHPNEIVHAHWARCIERWIRDHWPPDIAPSTTKGSAPAATALGRGASGGSWERSSRQAKKRT